MKQTSNEPGRVFRGLRRRFSILRLGELGFAVFATATLCTANASVELKRNLPVSSAESVLLSVQINKGDVDILYDRDGQVSISAVAQATGDSRLDDNYFSTAVTIEQSGNHVTVRQASSEDSLDARIKIRFRINVPFRTEVNSTVGEGKQTVSGILGPVEVRAERGDIKASYVSKTVHAEVGSGNLDLQVIGEGVEARSLAGNISGERLPQGIRAETEDGDITLAVVGPSTATVKKGSGRVDVRGARGLLTASTDGGDLHVVAVPHDEWKLSSRSGTIRLDLPPAANFALDASTDSGKLQIERGDMSELDSGLRQLTQQVNGGGKSIVLHTESGRIAIQ